MLVHRVSYETWVGPIPDDWVVDHLCSNKRCFNPDHLEAVTQRVNIKRAQERDMRRWRRREEYKKCVSRKEYWGL